MREIKVRRSYEKEGFSRPVFEYRPDWPYISIGFGDEQDFFIENLSLLVASGMGIASALSAINLSIKGPSLKKVTTAIEQMDNDGVPLWQAMEKTNFTSDRVVALIRSGEESGKLPEHLNLVTIQQNKEKKFNSRLKSALLYPGIVLVLSLVVAVVSSWLVLPKLVSVFQSSQGTLPFNTRVLIWLGAFLSQYGVIAVPALILAIVLFVYFVFFFKKTKFIGDAILFAIPGIKSLIQGVELARFGYIFGVLLQAGFQVNEALESVKKGTTYYQYVKFYNHLQDCILKGETFKTAFSTYKKTERFIPIPIQQLVISSEKSGRLPETFIKIGVIFEEKTEAMSRDLSVVLEPIVLIVVGLIVAFVVLAVIGPIYGLSSQI
ncbi:MAG: type II secretion system F family protein [Candidatus Paceibacterota bacterium]|jgi:type IV pilus assembly protein PilC